MPFLGLSLDQDFNFFLNLFKNSKYEACNVYCCI